jgi:predicted alpha-1,2-mannosidase
MARTRVAIVLLLAACSTPATDAGLDASSPDAPAVDAPRNDAGTDAGPPSTPHAAAAPLVQWVDPQLGTGGVGYNDLGSASVAPQWPFGMARPGPDTADMTGMAPGYLHCSGYHAGDDYVTAFSETRMHGTGANDYGIVSFMPSIGATTAQTMPNGLLTHFDEAMEHVAVGSYDVTLDGAIRVELTASQHVGFHRITFPTASGAALEAALFVDLAHAEPGVTVTSASATIDPVVREMSGTITTSGGYSGGMTMYFVTRFDTAFATSGTWEPGALHMGMTTRSGTSGGLYVTFAPGSVVRSATGLSYVDLTGARANLDAESNNLDFDAAHTALVAEWERRLGVLALEGRSDDDFRLTYTALYHAQLMPTLLTDVDHRYRGLDRQIATASGFTYYSDFSLWDTYRTLHSLIALIDPPTQLDFVRSLMAMADAIGHYPRWPLATADSGGMIGDPAAVVLADSWARGVRGFDLMHAYTSFQAEANGTDPFRGGIQNYITLGYVASEDGGTSAARTMEYAIADAALASMAHALGNTADETRFTMRSRDYQHVFDPHQGYFVARHADGTFVTVSPGIWSDSYAEGDSWQYLWLAPQDMDGLATTLGGRDVALMRLRDLFARSQRERHTPLPPIYYWQGNEPDIHVPYLFAAWGSPNEAAVWSRWALRAFYSLGPAGLPGNDDSGTMSAWLVFTELGFYPICGTDQYLFGSPLFTHATLHLPGGDLVIDAPNAWDPHPYVTALTLNGATIPRDRIAHDTIAHGGMLHFDQSDVPGP